MWNEVVLGKVVFVDFGDVLRLLRIFNYWSILLENICLVFMNNRLRNCECKILNFYF